MCHTWKWTKTQTSHVLLSNWEAQRDTWQRLEGLAVCGDASSHSILGSEDGAAPPSVQ